MLFKWKSTTKVLQPLKKACSDLTLQVWSIQVHESVMSLQIFKPEAVVLLSSVSPPVWLLFSTVLRQCVWLYEIMHGDLCGISQLLLFLTPLSGTFQRLVHRDAFRAKAREFINTRPLTCVQCLLWQLLSSLGSCLSIIQVLPYSDFAWVLEILENVVLLLKPWIKIFKKDWKFSFFFDQCKPPIFGLYWLNLSLFVIAKSLITNY